MSYWPQYESHKVIRAARIVVLRESGPEDSRSREIWVDPGDGTRELFTPSVAAMAFQAEVGGWAIKYNDGFRSVHPMRGFEQDYRLVPNPEGEMGENSGS